MNYDELKEQYGSAEAAAREIASGHHDIIAVEGDYEALPESFRSLIIFEQNKIFLNGSEE